MARGELLRRLFLSYARRDDHAFRTAALEVISEEHQKQNHALAKDLLTMIEKVETPMQPTAPALRQAEPIPRDRDRQALLADVRHPQRSLAEIILETDTKHQVLRVLDEYRRVEVLRVHGLRPKTRLLFCGPPGCGKTMCAEVIASELSIPLLYIRFDAIISSLLGETSSNLRKVFDYARTGRWVILLDEFDAIGKSRSDESDHGELKRVVNSFLQLLDSFEGSSLIIAATNHERLLDRALWRRFDDVLVFKAPSNDAIRALLAARLKAFPTRGVNFAKAAQSLKGVSHADVESACIEAIKTAILGDADAVTQSMLEEAIGTQRRRIRVGAGNRI